MNRNSDEAVNNTHTGNNGDRYRAVFPNRHTLLPVIHAETEEQVLCNADIAREAGCDGIFLINHAISAQNLLEIHRAVVNTYPDWWVGVNCLSVATEDVFGMLPAGVDGVWADHGGIDDSREDQPEATTIQSKREASGWKGLYFGGVAFKYQRPVQDPARAARLAMSFMDVVTTSGPGTGLAASVEKIRTMKQALGAFPLAIASGITPENVHEYLDHADCFLVATGIAESFNELDAERVSALVDGIRYYSQEGKSPS